MTANQPTSPASSFNLDEIVAMAGELHNAIAAVGPKAVFPNAKPVEAYFVQLRASGFLSELEEADLKNIASEVASENQPGAHDRIMAAALRLKNQSGVSPLAAVLAAIVIASVENKRMTNSTGSIIGHDLLGGVIGGVAGSIGGGMVAGKFGAIAGGVACGIFFGGAASHEEAGHH